MARIITDETKKEMKRVLEDIQSGRFVRDFVLENAAGQPSFKATRRRQAEAGIEEVGAKLRAMMPWIAKNRSGRQDQELIQQSAPSGGAKGRLQRGRPFFMLSWCLHINDYLGICIAAWRVRPCDRSLPSAAPRVRAHVRACHGRICRRGDRHCACGKRQR